MYKDEAYTVYTRNILLSLVTRAPRKVGGGGGTLGPKWLHL
jgi:hypothetical protein